MFHSPRVAAWFWKLLGDPRGAWWIFFPWGLVPGPRIYRRPWASSDGDQNSDVDSKSLFGSIEKSHIEAFLPSQARSYLFILGVDPAELWDSCERTKWVRSALGEWGSHWQHQQGADSKHDYCSVWKGSVFLSSLCPEASKTSACVWWVWKPKHPPFGATRGLKMVKTLKLRVFK